MVMLRNFDLPEALIFYGMDTVMINSKTSPPAASSSSHSVRARPGVKRLMDEAQRLDIPAIVLSEHLTMDGIAERMHQLDDDYEEEDTVAAFSFRTYHQKGLLHYRSSLEEFPVDDSDVEYDYYVPPRYIGEGIGHAPCPGALYDAVNTITIEPKGFGGSGGFGVKKWEAQRIPLPQHCVVFVCSTSDGQNNNDDDDVSSCIDRSDGSDSISRDRCIACRAAGMRVIYIEDEKLACTAEDVSDGIVETLGTTEDWEMVTMDDISTPGSFWLNMAQPKDMDGFKVNTEDVITEYVERRRRRISRSDNVSEDVKPEEAQVNIPPGPENAMGDDLDEDELAALLADIDPL